MDELAASASDWNNKLLQALIDYTKSIPGFRFVLRQRDNNSRLSHGFWFQGTEKYSFIGFFDRTGGVNRTRSLGFNVVFNKKGPPTAQIELVFKNENDKNILEAYRRIADEVNGFTKINERKYILVYDSTDILSNLKEFVTIQFPIITNIVREMKLESKLLISEAKFNKMLSSTLSIKDQLKNDLFAPAQRTNYWIFQGNPKIFRIIDCIADDALRNWNVVTHKSSISKGDKVILWVTGPHSGCYALCEVTSEVYFGLGEEIQKKYNLDQSADKPTDRVKLKITHNLSSNPITKSQVESIKELYDLKVGSQGTNFSATEEQYMKLLEIAEKSDSKKYWLFQPGINADMWDIFYKESYMAIGWDSLGDLRNYSSKQEIFTKLQELEKTTDSKKNDATANYEFLNVLSKGDIVILKSGIRELLGYGEIVSDYYYDDSLQNYKHCRKVKWIKKGKWESDHKLVLKTLTDITAYPSEDPKYQYYYQRLLALMEGVVPASLNNYPLNTILYGPPGTGKTYNTIDRAVEIVTGQASVSHADNKIIFDRLRNQGQIAFVTFHQNYSYEDFMVGLRPDTDNEQLRFKRHKGIFYEIARIARDNYLASKEKKALSKSFDEVFNEVMKPLVEQGTPVSIKMSSGISFSITDITDYSLHFTKSKGDSHHTLSIQTIKDVIEGRKQISSGLAPYYNPLINVITEQMKPSVGTQAEELKRYVLIIDEINRANISKVFGEIITLLEDDKRLGQENELKVTLPDGEKDFSLPPNLYLLATMNTADKSIALVDIALRRRFEFIGKYPEYTDLTPEEAELLKKINDAIFEKKKSADYLIGHAYFMKKLPVETVLITKIIPLLMEYFSGKIENVSSLFNSTAFNVTYDSSTYNWLITKR